ncbi:MAG: Crp/Fnr family transcriptional regulator [Bdellovibrionota bacterium]
MRLATISRSTPMRRKAPSAPLGDDLARVRALEVLRSMPAFSACTEEALQEFSREMRPQGVRRGQRLFRAGDKVERFYLIASGLFKMLREVPGGRQVVFEVRGSGQPLGACIAVDQCLSPCTAQAASDATVFSAAVPSLRRLFGKHPSLSQALWGEVADCLRSAREMQSCMALSVEERLARVFSQLAGRFGERRGPEIRLPRIVTRQDLADMVGATIETTIRTLSHWKKRGIYRDEEGTMVLVWESESSQKCPGCGPNEKACEHTGCLPEASSNLV